MPNSDLNRVLWRCRRGTRELDRILIEFAENRYLDLSAEEQDLFDLLLKYEDPILTEWLCMDVTPEDQGMVKIVQTVLSTATR